MSASNYLEAAWLNTLRNTAFSVTTCYVKLHLTDPGEDCTSGPALEDTRVACTFGAPSGGSMSNSAAVSWTNVSDTETYAYFSLWDTVGPSGGNALGSAALSTGRSVTTGDDAEFAIGALTWAVT
jgi:hypothetical protein